MSSWFLVVYKMKKNSLILLVFVFVITNVFSQKYFGKVTYKATMLKNKQFNFDTVKVSENTKNILKGLRGNKEELLYSLSFNQEASVFEKEELLNKSKNIMLDVYVGKDKFYYNKINDELIGFRGSGRSALLIEYPKIKWKMINETRIINGYLCGKSTTNIIENSINKKVSRIIAWYAYDLPYNYGPTRFTGLPGLILELEYEGKYKLRVTKVILKNKRKKDIKLPSKGKRILLSEYEKILRNRFSKRHLERK